MKKVGILTSGGDAQGMNACIYYTTKRLLDEGYEVYGIYQGYNGLLNKEFVKINYDQIDGILNRGGTFLKSSRSLDFPNRVEEAANILKEQGIEILVCLGGNGTFFGARELTKFGIKVFGIPCTIDNDLYYTDFSIGYKTAVQICVQNIEALKVTMEAHDRISIVQTMGRDCGFIALESGLLAGCKYIIIPEKTLSKQAITKLVKKDIEKGVLSNTICFAEGATKYGTAQDYADYLKEKTGSDIKVNVLGHLQRGGDPVAEDILLALRFSNKIVNDILEEKYNKVVGIQKDKIVSINVEEIELYTKHKNSYYKELMNVAFK